MFVLITFMIIYRLFSGSSSSPIGVGTKKPKLLTNFITLIQCTVYNRSRSFLSPSFETGIHHICSAYAFLTSYTTYHEVVKRKKERECW